MMKVVITAWVAVASIIACTSFVSAFTTTTTTTTTMPIVVMPAQQKHQQSSVLLQATRMNNDGEQQKQQQQKKNKTMNKKKKMNMTMSKSQKKDIMNTKLFGTALLSASLMIGSAFTGMAVVLTASPQQAMAAGNGGSKVVGELKGSGLVFKDTLQIERFEDPKVRGVELYISNFQRPITEKLNKGFFNDPSQASVACARTGSPVSIASNIEKGTSGGEVFEESRSLLFKTLRVQRIYDEEKNTVVYVSYNTRLDKSDDKNKSRFQSTLCAINLDDYSPPPTAGAATADAVTKDTFGAPATAIKVVK